uniref:C2H2-type domain-containing protein n=1 Tax=Macrostomum lignano TaxID=282301 RepID=A0A1I8IDM7_9PLAT
MPQERLARLVQPGDTLMPLLQRIERHLGLVQDCLDDLPRNGVEPLTVAQQARRRKISADVNLLLGSAVQLQGGGMYWGEAEACLTRLSEAVRGSAALFEAARSYATYGRRQRELHKELLRIALRLANADCETDSRDGDMASKCGTRRFALTGSLLLLFATANPSDGSRRCHRVAASSETAGLTSDTLDLPPPRLPLLGKSGSQKRPHQSQQKDIEKQKAKSSEERSSETVLLKEDNRGSASTRAPDDSLETKPPRSRQHTGKACLESVGMSSCPSAEHMDAAADGFELRIASTAVQADTARFEFPLVSQFTTILMAYRVGFSEAGQPDLASTKTATASTDGSSGDSGSDSKRCRTPKQRKQQPKQQQRTAANRQRRSSEKPLSVTSKASKASASSSVAPHGRKRLVHLTLEYQQDGKSATWRCPSDAEAAKRAKEVADVDSGSSKPSRTRKSAELAKFDVGGAASVIETAAAATDSPRSRTGGYVVATEAAVGNADADGSFELISWFQSSKRLEQQTKRRDKNCQEQEVGWHSELTWAQQAQQQQVSRPRRRSSFVRCYNCDHWFGCAQQLMEHKTAEHPVAEAVRRMGLKIVKDRESGSTTAIIPTSESPADSLQQQSQRHRQPPPAPLPQHHQFLPPPPPHPQAMFSMLPLSPCSPSCYPMHHHSCPRHFDLREPSDCVVMRREAKQSRGTRVTLCLTAGLALLSALLNSILLRALFRLRPRQRTSGMLSLSCLEVALSLMLAGAMLSHAWELRGVGAAASMLLLNSAHALQMARNHWLVALSAIRLAALVRPRGNAAAAATAAASGRGRFGRARQLALLASLVIVSIVTLFAVAVGFEKTDSGDEMDGADSAPDGAGTVWNSSAMGMFMSEQAFNWTEFQRGARSLLLKYSVFSAVGVLLPGLAVTGITVKTVCILRAGRLLHPATRRITKAVALLCAAFVACQFPLAAVYAATAAYLLSLADASADRALSVVVLLESVSHWSLVLVPADSCLTFLVLARYSRHFRALLLGRRCCRCCHWVESADGEHLALDAAVADREIQQRQRRLSRHQQRQSRRRQHLQLRAGQDQPESLAMFQLTSANQVTAGVTSQFSEGAEGGAPVEAETAN